VGCINAVHNSHSTLTWCPATVAIVVTNWFATPPMSSAFNQRLNYGVFRSFLVYGSCFKFPKGSHPTTHKHRSSPSVRYQRPETDLPGCLNALLVFLRQRFVDTSRPFLSFAPFQRHQIRQPGYSPHRSRLSLPGFASPSTFPSQGFSPPQGFTSRVSLQPCFMLLPLIGFSPSELSPRSQP
jgi:hypothetical protein